MIGSISLTIGEAMANSQLDAAEQLGDLGLDLADRLLRSSIPTLKDRFAANALKLQLLTAGNRQTYAGEEFVTLVHALEVRKNEAALLDAATDATVVAYGNQFLLEGEENALLWLRNEVTSARPPVPGP